MTAIDEPDSRDGVFDSLAFAAASGYLGLFVGSGFSKAATAGDAPSFDQLLAQTAKALDLPSDFDVEPYRRKSLAQIASALVQQLETNGNPSPGLTLRTTVADLCNLQPNPTVATSLATGLSDTTPAWFITTNYDLLLEHLLPRARSVLPAEPLVPNQDAPPIYHLHGHRAYPASIRITEEDYVTLLAPIDYQRLKLPLLLLESTTLMLGYSLGDINVRAALAWSRSFRHEHGLQIAPPQGAVVQALFSSAPKEEPYVGPSGETILEIDSLPDFLSRLAYQRVEMAGMMSRANDMIASFLSDPESPELITSDAKKREFLIWMIRGSLRYVYPDPTLVVDLLTRALDPIWTKATDYYGFQYYGSYLTLLLELAERLNLTHTKPQVVAFVARSLDRIGYYFHTEQVAGYAWKASGIWVTQHQRIPQAVKDELMSYAHAQGLSGLERLLTYARKASSAEGS